MSAMTGFLGSPVLCKLLFVFVLLAPVIARGDDAAFAVRTRVDRIGRIIAPVMINGRGPYRFIVDTGANHSTISAALAASLNLNATEKVLLHGVTGSAEVDAVHVDSLRAGQMSLDDELLAVIDTPMTAGVDGILGVAGSTHEQIAIDFRRDRITIGKSRADDRPTGDRIRVPAMRISGGLIAVKAWMGNVRVIAIIDTGAERTIGNLALRDALLRTHHASGGVSRIPVYGATAEVGSADSENSPPIDLGDGRVSGLTMFYSDLHVFDVWKLQGQPAVLIGMDVLGTLESLVIDYRLLELCFGV
jgi:hypothetical protein